MSKQAFPVDATSSCYEQHHITVKGLAIIRPPLNDQSLSDPLMERHYPISSGEVQHWCLCYYCIRVTGLENSSLLEKHVYFLELCMRPKCLPI